MFNLLFFWKVQVFRIINQKYSAEVPIILQRPIAQWNHCWHTSRVILSADSYHLSIRLKAKTINGYFSESCKYVEKRYRTRLYFFGSPLVFCSLSMDKIVGSETYKLDLVKLMLKITKIHSKNREGSLKYFYC